MDETKLIQPLCAARCVWYQPGKAEEERCEGFARLLAFLAVCPELLDKLTPIGRLPSPTLPGPALLFDGVLAERVCGDCPFPPEGCDLRNPASPHDGAPCGGLIALDELLATGALKSEELSQEEPPPG